MDLSIASNFRTQAHRIIKRAGLVPWGKTFQNLRASRETELVETFPVHVVTGWLGNSPDIARKHYLQTHEEHFRRAVEVDEESGGTRGGLNATVSPCMESQSEKRTNELIAFRAMVCNGKPFNTIQDKTHL